MNIKLINAVLTVYKKCGIYMLLGGLKNNCWYCNNALYFPKDKTECPVVKLGKVLK